MNSRNLSFFLQSLNSFSALAWLEAKMEQAWQSLSPAAPSNCIDTMTSTHRATSPLTELAHQLISTRNYFIGCCRLTPQGCI